MKSRFSLAIFVAGLAAFLSLDIGAFPVNFPVPPSPSSVIEYFNTITGHYFYTLYPNEEDAIASGAVGPGWVKTGLAFSAWPSVAASEFAGTNCSSAQYPCMPVTRFYAPSPNTHFYASRPNELAAVQQPGSGWIREQVAFYIAFPDASGNCAAWMSPVYRLYNQRFLYNDSNHRYTTSNASRQYLIDQGWADEGAVFCSYDPPGLMPHVAPIAGPVLGDFNQIQQDWQCDESSLASCVGLTNLHFLSLFNGSDPYGETDLLDPVIGWPMPGRYTIDAVTYPEADLAPLNTFVQLANVNSSYMGVHLNYANRIGPGPVAIEAMRKLSDDERIYPYRVLYGTPSDLRIQFWNMVKSLRPASGDTIEGTASVQFRDDATGHALRFDVAGYGNMADGETIAADPVSGIPVIRVTSGIPSRFGRFTGNAPTVHAPDNYELTFGINFDAAIDREEFAQVIAAARTIDPLLSAAPENYSVMRISHRNVMRSEGDLGATISTPMVGLSPQL